MKRWLELKSVTRSGWVNSGVDQPESVAAHSWGMAVLAMHLCPNEINKQRVLEMCLVHDLPEVIVGDLTPEDDCSTKSEDELAAMKELAPHWVELFVEYESQESQESIFVKSLDKLDMALQAMIYREQGLDLDEFVESARVGIKHPWIRNLIADMDMN